MYVPLTQFAPDDDQAGIGTIISCSNMVPTLRGYKAAPSAQSGGVDALAAECCGAVVARKLDNSKRFISGTATKLYELSSTTWTDVSGAAYHANTDVRWSFAQFGNVTLAANKGDTLQSSSSGAFAAVAGAPKASIVETVNQFVFLCDIDDGTDKPNAWICCGIGDYTNWTPSVANQCATANLTSAPGAIKAAKRLGDGLVVYKERAIYVGSYVGDQVIWDFQEVPGAIGAFGKDCVVNIGPAHLYVGLDNFYMFDGSRPVPIGNPIKEYFFSTLATGYGYRIRSVHDFKNSLVYFFYPSASSGTLDSCVVYNYRSNKWGVVSTTIEDAIEYAGQPYTYGSLGTYFATYADLPAVAYGSEFWNSGIETPAVFDTAHTVKTLNGSAGSWNFTVFDIGDDEQVTLLKSCRVRMTATPTTMTMTNSSRMSLDTSLTAGSTVSINGNCFYTLRSARWHRLTFAGTGDTEIYGINPLLEREGTE